MFYSGWSACKMCTRAIQKARRNGPRREELLQRKREEYARDKEKYRERRWLKKFDLSRKQYDDILEAQGGGCAICGSEDPKGRGEHFTVDHCHDTGKVRGLLCNDCNLCIGKLGDSAELLQRAVDYLS